EISCAPSIVILIPQPAPDGALPMREQCRSAQPHRRKLDAACRVALEQPFLLDQKIGKGADARFPARAVVETESFLLQVCQVRLNRRLRQLLRLKLSLVAR